MREVVILGSARSAGGRFDGSLKSMTAPQFGAVVVRETINRSGIEPDVIDQTIFGNAWQAGVGPNPARITAVNGGVPIDKPAVSVNVRCGSSIQAMIMGVQAIKAEDVDTARRCLALLSGRRHRVYTGIAIAAPDGRTGQRCVVTSVTFKRLSREDTAWYLDSGEWRGKAGGYGIQGRAAILVRALSGSYSNVVGLPLYETAQLLHGLGWRS